MEFSNESIDIIQNETTWEENYRKTNYDYSREILDQDTHTRTNQPPKIIPKKSKELDVNKGIVFALLFGLLAVAVVWFCYHQLNDQHFVKKERFVELKANFPNQSSNFWRSLEVGLENVLDSSNTQPNIVLFIFNGIVFPEDLFNGIVEITKEWIGNNVEPLELTKTDFSTEDIENDYGVVLDIYTPKLIESGFMIVRDINDIPANAAQAFHSFCDVYNPAVERAVIFFTMKVNEFVVAENSTKVAELLLKNVWNVLQLNVLQPLIGRITDDVLVIK